MRIKRDSQKNKCYAWERAVTGGAHYRNTMTLEQAEAMVKRLWRSERGRYGLANSIPPEVRSKHHGRATASGDHKLHFPKWALNEWVVLHEMAHRLTPKDEAHGPRFVGVLIGLVCRHFKQDREQLLSLAYEMGLRVHDKSIGTVPTVPLYVRVARYLPGNPVEIAVAMNIELGTNVNYKQVRGAALRLIRDGKAAWKGDVLVAVKPKPAPQPVAVPKKQAPERLTKKQRAEALAKTHGISLDKTDTRLWVYPPEWLEPEDDPYDEEHFCDTWAEVLGRVQEYVEIIQSKANV